MRLWRTSSTDSAAPTRVKASPATGRSVRPSSVGSTGILLVSCPDQPGIVAAVATFVAAHGGNVIDLQQHTDHTDAAFFQRVEFELDDFDLARDEVGRA